MDSGTEVRIFVDGVLKDTETGTYAGGRLDRKLRIRSGRSVTGETRTGTNAFTASYALDPAGNRTRQTAGPATTSFTLDNGVELPATSSSTGGYVNRYRLTNVGTRARG